MQRRLVLNYSNIVALKVAALESEIKQNVLKLRALVTHSRPSDHQLGNHTSIQRSLQSAFGFKS